MSDFYRTHDFARLAGVLLKMWADRDHWSASLRWQVEAIHWMPFGRIQRVADFLDHAAIEVR